MTAFDPTVAVRIAESQIPMSADYAQDAGRMTPQREAEIRRLVERTTETAACVASPGALRSVLAELDRVRAERDGLKQLATRAIYALKSPAPAGSEHYRSGWDDGLEAALDATRDALAGGAQ